MITKKLTRGISADFAEAFKKCELNDLYQIHQDEIFIGVRNQYLNLYYNCDSIARVEYTNKKITCYLDQFYLSGKPVTGRHKIKVIDPAEICLQYNTIKANSESKSTDEKKAQSKLVLLNNNNSGSRWYCFDVEWVKAFENQNKKDHADFKGRFDIMAITKEKPHRVALIELKYGRGAIGGKSGICKHIKDFEKYKDNGYFNKQEVCDIISSQKNLGVAIPDGLQKLQPEDIAGYEFYVITLDNNAIKGSTPKQTMAGYLFDEKRWGCKRIASETVESKFGDVTKATNPLHVHFLFSTQTLDNMSINDIIEHGDYERINSYREKRKQHDVSLIRGSQIFNGDPGKKPYFLKDKNNPNGVWLPKADLLMEGKNNLFPKIGDEVVLYFALNGVAFHHTEGDSEYGFCIPSGHTLSSQIACLNHLYPLRYDKDAVLAIARQICPAIKEVLPIETDKFFPAYISFEVVSDADHLNEMKPGQKPTRGTMCTSVDALIYGKLKDKNIILPIEWKYTENYHNAGKPDKDYSIEDRGRQKEGKGLERLRRYSSLITGSKQLSLKRSDYKGSVYFFEPFYQLMRQTLWAEQMVAHKHSETIRADDYIHVHVVPDDNRELLDVPYTVSGKGMLATWHSCLADPNKYQLITLKNLLAAIDRAKHQALVEYLATRYWTA